MIRYWPEPSVTAVRTCSMRAGLRTSTVTPGSTPPVSSVTVPPIPWALAAAGSSSPSSSPTSAIPKHARINFLPRSVTAAAQPAR